MSNAGRTRREAAGFPCPHRVPLGPEYPHGASKQLFSFVSRAGRLVHDGQVHKGVALDVQMVGRHRDLDRLAGEFDRPPVITAPCQHTRPHLAPNDLR